MILHRGVDGKCKDFAPQPLVLMAAPRSAKVLPGPRLHAWCCCRCHARPSSLQRRVAPFCLHFLVLDAQFRCKTSNFCCKTSNLAYVCQPGVWQKMELVWPIRQGSAGGSCLNLFLGYCRQTT